MFILKTLNIGVAIFAVTLVFNLFSMPVVLAQEEKVEQEMAEGKNAHGEYELETMTVTAEKRKESIQAVPASISALSEIQIEDAGIQNIEDIIYHIPNLYMGKTGSHSYGSWLSMRGVSGMPGDLSTSPAVGFFVDGVYYSGGYGCN